MKYWTPERDKQLRDLRAESLTFEAIGARMGCTKNQIIGRARRIGLLKAEAPRGARVRSAVPVRGCEWPIGDVGAPGFRFCGAVRTPGKPYCPEHTAKATGERPTARQRSTGLGGIRDTSTTLIRARHRA